MVENVANNVVDIGKGVIEEYSDLREFIKDEIVESELGEVLDDCTKLVGGLIKLNNYMHKHMLKCFLRRLWDRKRKSKKIKEIYKGQKKCIIYKSNIRKYKAVKI